MRRSTRNLLLGTVLGGLVLGGAAGWAGEGYGMHRDPSRMVARMADRLDLSEEQQTRIEALLAGRHEQSAADHTRLQELREQLREMRGDFDAGEARKLADEIGEITSRMVFDFANTQAQIYQALNDEQRAKMDEFMENHEPRRDRWHKHAAPPAK